MLWFSGGKTDAVRPLKLGGVADAPEGCAGVQRDLGRLEKWTNMNLVKFNKGKGEVLPLGTNNSRHQCIAGKQLGGEGSGRAGGHQGEPEPTTCPWGKER